MNKSKIIFDISEAITFLNKNNCYSGIQRVVAMVLSEFQKKNSDQDIWISFFQKNKHNYYGLKITDIGFDNWDSPGETKKILKQFNIIGACELLEKYHNNIIKYYFHRTRLDIAFLAKNQSLFNSKGLTIKDWKLFRCSNHHNSDIKKLIDVIQPGDKLVLLDSTWKKNNIEFYQNIKSKGVEIYTFVHDLIPILTPQFVDGNSTKIFYNWITNSINYTDCFIANSCYTGKDLREFLNSKNCSTNVKILPLVQVGLSSGISSINKTAETLHILPNKIDRFIKASMRARSILADDFILVLVSNTKINPVSSLLIIWKKMLDSLNYDIPRLVFVVDNDAIDSNLKKFLDKTNNLYGYISIFTDIEEDELRLFYENCQFVVDLISNNYSLINIDQAAFNNKLIIVSDQLVLTQYNKLEYVEQCNLFSFEKLENLICNLLSNIVYLTNKDNRNNNNITNDISKYETNIDNNIKFLYANENNKQYVLHVGTIEVRKNIWRLVLAWKKILESGKKDVPYLVLAGRKGWFNDKLWDLLKVTDNLNGKVIVLHNVSDAQLDKLYKGCLFTIMISNYEGWGLPVGEALAYGKTSVVAQSTSLPEVGMDLVEYCNPLSINSIAASIIKLVYDVEYRLTLEKKIALKKLRNWTDVAQDLAKILGLN